MEGRCMRKKRRVNYRELLDIKLPKEKRTPRDQLYPVTVLDRNESQVKIHYVGYTSTHDEWRDISELEQLETAENDGESASSAPLHPYSLYMDLSIKIKQALTCGRKGSPIIRIAMSFDLIQFNGGLKEAGFLSRKFRGIERFKIKQYRDLNSLLGKNWHYRGLNANGDYGYALLDTVEFYIFKSKPLTEYHPSGESDSTPQSQTIDTGHTLIFSFVCKHGTHSTFGKDRQVFFT